METKNTLETIYIDLSKLSGEEQINKIYNIIKNDNIDSFTRKRLRSGHTFKSHFLINEGDWVLTQLDYKLSKRTELTYPEFIRLFEGGEGETQIENIKDIAHTEGVLVGLRICKQLWAQGTISHETIKEEIYHYQEELENLQSITENGESVFNIDFNGNVSAGLKIVNGEIMVIGAVNGWGDNIAVTDIKITKVTNSNQ